MSEDHVCFKTITEKLDGDNPFERPITWNKETGDLTASEWTIKVYKMTKAGNISKKGPIYLFIKYCPFCGELVNPPTPND